MGRALIEAILESEDLWLAGALEHSGHEALGQDPGQWSGRRTPVRLTSDVRAALGASQVLVDFTRPEGTLTHLAACVEQKRAIVIGTTGFDEEGRKAIREAGRHIPIVFSPNMSVGVNLMLVLLDITARVLRDGFDVEIVEAHHRHKVDAPSGTALRMGEVVATARGHRLEDVAIYGREGITGERQADAIGFATLRGGDVGGDHTVSFMGQGERVEIAHKASSRANFVLGALRATRFLAQQSPGLYDMQDVLGLKAWHVDPLSSPQALKGGG